MDPMAGGMPPGAPPMDPMAGGMPPGAGPMPPEIQMAIDQAVQTALAGQGGAPVAAPGAPGAGAKKLDPVMLYLALERIRKLIDNMYKINGWELPSDILDDNMMAQAIAGMPVQSPPIGQGGDGAAPPPPPGAGGEIPGIGTSPPIAPPEPAKMAAHIVMGTPVPPEASPAEHVSAAANRIDRVAYLSRSLRGNGQ